LGDVTQLRKAAAALAVSVLSVAAFAPATMGQAKSRPAGIHVVGTFDGSVVRIYVDGRPEGRASTQLRAKPGPVPVEIGSFYGGERWNGTIDEVALYDRPLSPDAIRRHHQIGTGEVSGRYTDAVRRTRGLVAYWRLNDRGLRKAADVLGRHPGVYPRDAGVRVRGLIAHDRDRAFAFKGGPRGIFVNKARDLSFPDGFTLEAWVTLGARRAQPIVVKIGDWFLQTNPAGQPGVGVSSGKRAATVYSKARPQVSTQAPPRRSARPLPVAETPAAPSTRNSDGSGSGLVMVVFLLTIAVGTWLVVRVRRRTGASLQSQDQPRPSPDEGKRRDHAPGKP
jgi:hypothetical protein